MALSLSTPDNRNLNLRSIRPISDVTAEVIHQKQIEEQIYKAKLMINRRFGRNTWNEILELREKRIEENKIKRKKAKEAFKEHQKTQREFWKKVWYWTWQTALVGGILAGFVWYLIWLSNYHN